MKTSAYICPSAQAGYILVRDDSGKPINITDLSDQSEVQSFSLKDTSKNGSFKITVDKSTTAEISFVEKPPLVFTEWHTDKITPGTFDLSTNILTRDDLSKETLYEIFDDKQLIGSVTLDLSSYKNVTKFNDGRVDGRNIAVNWVKIGSFTFKTNIIRCRVSSPKDLLWVDTLRIEAKNGDVVYLGPQDPSTTHVNLVAGYDTSSPNILSLDGGKSWMEVGAGAGSYFVLDPAVIQSELEKLPNIGKDNVSVTGNGAFSIVDYKKVDSPLIIRFKGALAKSSFPLITTNLNTNLLNVLRISSGDCWPKFYRNGQVIPTGNPYWGKGHGDIDHPEVRTNPGYLSFIYFPWIQQEPATKYQTLADYKNKFYDGANTGWEPVSYGFAPTPWKTQGNSKDKNIRGPKAVFKEEGLPADEYQLSLTWAVDSKNSTDVICTITDRIGNVLSTQHINQKNMPDPKVDHGMGWYSLGIFKLTNLANDLIITIENNAEGYMVADTVKFDRITPNTSIKFSESDVITYTCGSGWCKTDNGYAPAITNPAPVVNLVNRSICPQITDKPRTMGGGWNINFNYTSAAVSMYNNRMASWFNPDPIHCIEDEDGNIVSYPGNPNSLLSIGLVSPWSSQGGYKQGGANVPSGHWTVLWDGSGDVTMDGNLVSSYTNKKTYNLKPFPGCYSPSVTVHLHPSSNTDGINHLDIRNIRVYPPGVDFINPTKFTTGFILKIAPTQSTRWLDINGAIQSNNLTFKDINPPQSRIGKYSAQRRQLTKIVSVKAHPFEGDPAFEDPHPYDPTIGPAYQVETETPHNMHNGYYVQFMDEPGPLPLSNGTQRAIARWQVPVTVHSPTVFSCQFRMDGGTKEKPVSMVGKVGNVGGSVYWDAGNGVPLEDIFEVSALTDTNIYWNTGMSNGDQLLIDLGTFFAKNLRPKQIVRVECSNEPWNTYSAPFTYFSSQSFAAGKTSSFVPSYIDMANHHWTLIREAMEKAVPGSSKQMLRVLGSCSGNPGLVAAYIEYAKANNIEFDEVALAPYISNGAEGVGGCSEVTLSDIVDVLTADQQLDLLELFFTYTFPAYSTKQTRDILNENKLQHVNIVNYEDGPSGMTLYPIPGRNPSRCIEKTHAMHRHPRMINILLFHNQQNQDAGVIQTHYYYLGGGGDFTAQGGAAAWSACTSTDQEPGTGDNFLDIMNVMFPDRLDLIRSQTLGAMNKWCEWANAPSK